MKKHNEIRNEWDKTQFVAKGNTDLDDSMDVECLYVSNRANYN